MPRCRKSSAQSFVQGYEKAPESQVIGTRADKEKLRSLPAPGSKKMMFVLPKATEFSDLEGHLLDLLGRLKEPQLIL